MLRVVHLSKAYGLHALFDDVSFSLNPGERIGLIGRNGHGKTTLFKILLGHETADDGQVIAPRDYHVGHLSQHLEFTESTVLDEACTALSGSEDGVDLTYKAEAALHGLGFGVEEFQVDPHRLSGGYQIRLNLAKVLISEPNLLLLDEPTNYLDIVSMRWLRRFLRNWPRELMIITHDRGFMDSVSTHTMAIHRGKIRTVEGSTEKMFAQIDMEEEIQEKTRLNQEKDRKTQERFIERFRAKASKAKAVQSRIKMLEKQGTVDRLAELKDLSFRFNFAPFPAKSIADVENLEFAYPNGETLIEDLSITVGAGDRLAVIGRNGKGKSTLLKLMAQTLEPKKGSLRFHSAARIAHYGQDNVDRLDANRTVEEEILSVHPEHSRGGARKICGLMMFEEDDALKKIAVLSGGERSRVLLGKLLVSPANVLLLDEPTNHLDLQSTEGLMHALKDFPGAVILVTHSELILRHVANRLVVFDDGRVRVFEGGYSEFLEQVGWAEEDGSANTAKAAPRIPRKELRRLRAEVVAEKSQTLKPLQAKAEKLENRIIELEEETARVDAELCDASTDGETDALAKLGRRSGELRRETEALFVELEEVTSEIEERGAAFEARLQELDR